LLLKLSVRWWHNIDIQPHDQSMEGDMRLIARQKMGHFT
jgi:hypothetical protein